MSLTRRTVLLSSLSVLITTARAEPAPKMAVSVRYRAAEQSPDRIEQLIVNVIERPLLKIPRVSLIRSRSDHGACFFEIQFDGGADASDIAVVTSEIDRLRVGDNVTIISREITLAKPLPAAAF